MGQEKERFRVIVGQDLTAEPMMCIFLDDMTMDDVLALIHFSREHGVKELDVLIEGIKQ